MATQLADRSPHLDLRSGKFRQRLTIELKSDLHSPLGGKELFAFSAKVGKNCLPSAQNPHQITKMMTFFLFSLTLRSSHCGEDLFFWSSLTFWLSHCNENFFLVFNHFFVTKLWLRPFLDETTFHLPYLDFC